MPRNRATSGIDLHLEPIGPGLRRGLTRALREAARTGRLAPGTRLPSSRALAADLGVARNTVAEAYADLVAEGWLTARQGSGTRVAARPVAPDDTAPRPVRRSARPAHDLRPGTPDVSAFPRSAWLSAARRALAVAPNDAFGHGDPAGRPELRAALADYLARVRGVRADPGRVVVCGGFGQALRLLGTVLRARGVRAVGVESYGFSDHRELLERAGLRTVPLPFDARGTDPGAPPEGVGAVLLTPAHQFPMGPPLSPERRTAVVEWARRTGGLVLEDDYDGEFRYDRRPIGALQGLAPERTVYLGTSSKSLAPGLRLSWTVSPPDLAAEIAAAKGRFDDRGVLDQLTFAEFLASGDHDRHVRASRTRYRRRRDALVAVAADAPGVRVTGVAAGLHAVLRLPPGGEESVMRAAAWQRLALLGLAAFRHPEADTEEVDAVVVGYGAPPDHAWAGALDALRRCLP
ncbi:PLP-dependent aminotransferase family protein [Streptomyces sp. ZYX-F-203]